MLCARYMWCMVFVFDTASWGVLMGVMKREETPVSKPSLDTPSSSSQIEIARWVANYKRIDLPEDVVRSRKAWWGWINRQIGSREREDARCAQVDFGLEVDYADPFSVIGAIRYKSKADETSTEEQAVRMILAGQHPYDVAESLDISPPEIERIAKEVEAGNFEIDWGPF